MLGQAENDQKKIEVLKDNYPAFYLAFCHDCNLSKKESQFINECALLSDVGPKQYSKFVHGYVLPTLKLQREAGLMVKGKFLLQSQVKFLVTDMKNEVNNSFYTGETNSKGQQHGYGVENSTYRPHMGGSWTKEGYWFNGQCGLERLFFNDNPKMTETVIQEFKLGSGGIC